MPLTFANTAQELTYHKVSDYLSSSLFKSAMRTRRDLPRFDLLYRDITLIEVDVLPWEHHPWDDSEMAIVRASSLVTVGNSASDDLSQYLLAENNRMRFGAFQLDDSGQVVFAHSVLGGEDMDLRELQTCILSVAAIATSYQDVLAEKFGVQRLNLAQWAA